MAATVIQGLPQKAEALCRDRNWLLGPPIGSGATATVFEVKTERYGPAALKMYSPDLLSEKAAATTRKRFALVTENLKNHSCDNLVKVFEGEENAQCMYMLMERVPGRCLAEVLKLVPGDKIRGIIQQIALAAKHLEDEYGLTHRDIKSDNIVVSDSFDRAVLLDLGVLRWLEDDEGSGTDNDGQLPFVATARYSSPEYMFRLIPQGPALWRALNYYQLGAVLHDLIQREPLFEDVVRGARDNRYLIAHAVATKIPSIKHRSDVPPDLILLAQRALQKDPDQRLSMVKWEDILAENRRSKAELLLGIGRANSLDVRKAGRASVWAKTLESELDQRLSQFDIHARHSTEIVDARRASVEISWRQQVDPVPEVDIAIKIYLEHEEGVLKLSVSAAGIDASDQSTYNTDALILSLPDDGENFPRYLAEQAIDILLEQAAEIMTLAMNAKAMQ